MRVRTRYRTSSVPPSPGVLYFFFGLFTLFGMVFSGVGVHTWSKAEATKKWEPAEGKVTLSDVGRHSSSKGSITYSAQVEYDYGFQGKTYKGNRIAVMTSSSSDRAAAQRRADRYPVGSLVTVHVDPQDPYEAVLETGGSGASAIFVLFGLVFAGIGLGGMANVPRMIAQSGINCSMSGQNIAPEPTRDPTASKGGEDLLGKL